MRDLVRASRTYELMTVLTPDVSEEAIPEALDQIAAYISNAGGTVTETLRESPWGRRRLAYPIRHAGRDVRDGFYSVVHFELDPGKVVDIERDLRLNDNVIRYLVTHYTPRPIDEAASAADEEEAVEGGATAEPASETAVESPIAPEEMPEAAATATEEAPAPDAPAEEASAEETDAGSEAALDEPLSDQNGTADEPNGTETAGGADEADESDER